MMLAAAPVSATPENTRPFRILVAAPAGGFGEQLQIMRAWLDRACGPGNWASAPGGLTGVVNDAVAFYFPDPAVARAFITRFACGYRPLGRDHSLGASDKLKLTQNL